MRTQDGLMESYIYSVEQVEGLEPSRPSDLSVLTLAGASKRGQFSRTLSGKPA